MQLLAALVLASVYAAFAVFIAVVGMVAVLWLLLHRLCRRRVNQ